MDPPTAGGAAAQDHHLFLEGYTFHVAELHNDHRLVLRVTATRENALPSGMFKTDIAAASIKDLTQGLCTLTAHLAEGIKLALSNSAGWSAAIAVAKCQDSGQERMVLRLKFDGFRKDEFDIKLVASPATLEDKVDYLVTEWGPRTNDTFSDLPGHRHANFDLFHGRRAFVKARGGSAHDSVTTGVQYSSGRHCLVFRIIRCTNNHCMLGVQEQPGALTPYPGSTTFPSGKAIYGTNGHCYRDGTNENYTLGGFGPGDYVGVLLDMNARTVTFSINGRAGVALPLTGQAYYFVANLYSVGDALKLVPKDCWHDYSQS